MNQNLFNYTNKTCINLFKDDQQIGETCSDTVSVRVQGIVLSGVSIIDTHNKINTMSASVAITLQL